MLFKKKRKKTINCSACNSQISKKYSFCPHCGSNLLDSEEVQKNFGMLGKTDSIDLPQQDYQQGFGITDKLIGSLVNSLVKNLDKQFKEANKDMSKANIKTFPNGIKIRIGPPQQNQRASKLSRQLTQQQLDKISSLPRTSAKTNIRRLSNKVIYELNTPGLTSPKDVFISKTESGFEIKAIGEEKVFINNLPIDLPLAGYSLGNDKLLVEFRTEE